MKSNQKLFSVMLSLCLLAGLLPVSAAAAELDAVYGEAKYSSIAVDAGSRMISFHNGVVVASDLEGRYGLVDRNEQVAVPFQYTDLTYLCGDLYCARSGGGKQSIINSKGETLLGPINANIWATKNIVFVYNYDQQTSSFFTKDMKPATEEDYNADQSGENSGGSAGSVGIHEAFDGTFYSLADRAGKVLVSRSPAPFFLAADWSDRGYLSGSVESGIQRAREESGYTGSLFAVTSTVFEGAGEGITTYYIDIERSLCLGQLSCYASNLTAEGLFAYESYDGEKDALRYGFGRVRGYSAPEPDLPEDNYPFWDVDQSMWYVPGIDYVVERGMMNGVGDGVFQPEGTTTRAMVVTILHRMERSPDASPSGFADVESGSWYQKAVDWAVANGVVNGVSESAFAPNQPVTREQLATMLFRYAEKKGYDVSGRGDLGAFSDGRLVSPYAVDSVSWAMKAGLIQGMGEGFLGPSGNATRAQVATILMRFCETVAA